MSLKDTLTNEKLNDRFKNPFLLVGHAIHMAKEAIARGEGMESHLATDILEVIAGRQEDLDAEEYEEQSNHEEEVALT